MYTSFYTNLFRFPEFVLFGGLYTCSFNDSFSNNFRNITVEVEIGDKKFSKELSNATMVIVFKDELEKYRL